MKRRIAAAAAVLWAVQAAAQEPGDCDRRCMSVALDTYLAAIVAHDPERAPLAADYRATENGIEAAPGSGLWRSAAGFGPLQRRYFDPVSRQAAFYGSVEEAGGTALLSLRLKFDGARIVEAEAIVARKGEPLYNPAGAIADQPRDEAALPLAGRSEREAMVRTAGLYFDALQGATAAVPKVDGCERVENGTRVTNRKRTGQDGHAADEMMSGDCAARLGGFSIAAVAHRRFPVVDEEAGVILGIGLFQRPPGAVWRDGSPRKRNLIHEYFALEAGRLKEIFAVMRYRETEEPDGTGW